MVDNTEDKVITPEEFLKEIREFSLTMNEECPEGHRRDPASGRCLPLGSYDHTKDSRSLDVDHGPEWRGTASVDNQEAALLDANEMDEPESCSEGTTFSFIQRKCISLEEADVEDNEEFARDEEGNPIEEEVEEAAAPGQGGHDEITMMQPEGRRDTVNHKCPANMFFDYKLRKCIPLNKDTVMASEDFEDEFKKAVSLWARIAMTAPDAMDGHKHVATLDGEGNGTTSISGYEKTAHSHTVKKFVVQDAASGENTSRHPGFAIPEEHRVEELEKYGAETPAPATTMGEEETAAPITTKQRKALPTGSFGVPRTRGFPLDSCNRVRNAMARFNQAKGLSSGEKATLKRKILAAAKKCGIKVDAFQKASTDEEYTAVAAEIMKGLEYEINENGQLTDAAATITTKQRKGLPDSAFGVPGKRKFPLDTCGRVRNAMARFNQAKGLTAGEKATLRRKIMSRAKACGIEVRNFAKATTDAEFAEITADLIRQVVVPGAQADEKRLEVYRAESQGRGPCPPGMMWDKKSKKCSKMAGFVTSLRDDADHSEIISKDPAGRKDTVGFQCPDGWFFDFGVRRCLPLDPAAKEKALEEEAVNAKPQNRDLVPRPKGKPARLPQDCPKGEIWDADLEKCKPLDSRKKTKSAEEEDAQDGKSGPANGPGKNKDSKGCGPGEFFNPVTKKCMPRKGAFTGKSAEENAQAVPGNREGLTTPPAGKVQHPTDCPPNTAWDAKNKICRPIDSMDKDRPSGSSPQAPRSVASLSTAQLVKQLDGMIREQADSKEKSRIAARDLPNAAFPPSLVSETRRVFMHHTPAAEDPYDNGTVDVGRLRNALARSMTTAASEGFQTQAFRDGVEHLLYHARALVETLNSKKE